MTMIGVERLRADQPLSAAHRSPRARQLESVLAKLNHRVDFGDFSLGQDMSIDWTPLADLIETHDRFLVTTHVRPDGDALGSEVGMAGLLRQKGKDVRVVNASPTPPRYDFLDPQRALFEQIGTHVQPAELADREVAVILDLSSWGQLGEMASLIRDFRGPRVVIDHH